ncbi:hypothetical protein RSAG8_02322, partial [Rhizoctonia solani AG-8 WAC10335]
MNATYVNPYAMYTLLSELPHSMRLFRICPNNFSFSDTRPSYSPRGGTAQIAASVLGW